VIFTVLEEDAMLLLKFLLISTGIALLVTAAAILGYDIYEYLRARKRIETAESGAEKLPEPELKLRVHPAGMICGAAVITLLLSSSFDVVPAGHAGIRVSQISGTEPNTLYPGIHLISPF
jgi:hypothetical protein